MKATVCKSNLLIALFFLIGTWSLAQNHWKLGGNNNLPPDALSPANNFLGSLAPVNLPILFGTNSINRMKLNQNVSYAVNGINNPRNGFLLLGADNNFTGGTLYNNGGAYSLLHLSSGVGGFAQEGGFRNWMRFGIIGNSVVI